MKLKHKETGLVGKFVSRTLVTKKYDSVIVEMSDGKKYIAPYEEFEEVS